MCGGGGGGGRGRGLWVLKHPHLNHAMKIFNLLFPVFFLEPFFDKGIFSHN